MSSLLAKITSGTGRETHGFRPLKELIVESSKFYPTCKIHGPKESILNYFGTFHYECKICDNRAEREVLVEKFTDKTQAISLRKGLVKKWKSSGLLDELKGLSKNEVWELP